MTVVLTGNDLTLDEVVRVARGHEQVELAPEAIEWMRSARAVVEHALESGELVYGLTTGVGVRKRVEVPAGELDVFNSRLILGHRVGTGPEAPPDAVRATLLRLANGFAKGTAGVRPELAERLVFALNDGVQPRVRMLGSVGEADLAPLADLAAGVLGDFRLAAKEGLALLNNNSFSTGLAALAVGDCARLLGTLDTAGALDLEAFESNLTILHPAVGETRPFPGLRKTLERLRALLAGSYLWAEGAARNLQDPLSFRCLPQVHGAVVDALDFVRRQLEIELNASQENPLLVPEEGLLISVGNFDLLGLASALDFLRIALASALTSAAERLLKLLQSPLTGLPEGLAARAGLAEEALSELGASALALVAEARLLAQPVSFEQPSSTHHEGIEDRITMAPLAARRLAEMVDLGDRLVAIELVVAAQAIELRDRQPLGEGTGRAFALVRERTSFLLEGQSLPSDLEPVRELVRSGDLA